MSSRARSTSRLLFMVGVARVERPLTKCSRLREIAEIVADDSEAAARDAGLCDAPRGLRFPHERRSLFARGLQFAAHKRRGPLTVGSREAL